MLLVFRLWLLFRSCNFLDLTVRQIPQGLSCDIFDKRSQPEYAGIEMIRMPHVHFQYFDCKAGGYQ
jgi:hypothetical protein